MVACCLKKSTINYFTYTGGYIFVCTFPDTVAGQISENTGFQMSNYTFIWDHCAWNSGHGLKNGKMSDFQGHSAYKMQ